ncbi:MAG: rRNA methyltransferase [Oscillospiraceae bacterium]|nr:rRNA methyltransferase [Oscillospiraceae bacterium]
MDLPVSLRLAIEEKAADYSTAELAKEAAAISRRYRDEVGAGKRLVTTDLSALTYAIMRMPATFGAVSSALGYTLALSDFEPSTLLDVGAGTGAAAFAADEALFLQEVTCLEREKAMAKLGQEWMKSGSDALENARWIDGDITADAALPKAQLVTAAYVLGELSEADRQAAALRLWDACEGILLLVEPGTPAASAQLKTLRGLLLDAGAHLIAPCPHQKDCPLGKDDWCHFTCRVSRSRLHKQVKGGDAPYEDEKFSYLAVSRFPTQKAAARVLRHPRIESGNITLQLCTDEGIVTRKVTKKEGAAFKAARKADCGDVYPY